MVHAHPEVTDTEKLLSVGKSLIKHTSLSCVCEDILSINYNVAFASPAHKGTGSGFTTVVTSVHADRYQSSVLLFARCTHWSV